MILQTNPLAVNSSAIPLVISGAPRSGTSLLYNLFDGHTDISFLMIEGYLFEKIFDMGASNANLFVAAARCSLDEFIAGLREHHLMPPLHVPYEQNINYGTVSVHHLEFKWDENRFRKSLASNLISLKTVYDLWKILVIAYMSGLNAPVCKYGCLKSPDYGKSITAALDNIHEARGIVILRHPLQALDSLKRSRELRSEKQLTWPEFARCIAEMREMLLRLLELPKESVQWIRYEQLVNDPENTMRGLAEWLGLSFLPCLLEPTMLRKSWPGISSFEVTTGVDATPANRALQALNAEEIALAENALSGFEEFGYKLKL